MTELGSILTKISKYLGVAQEYTGALEAHLNTLDTGKPEPDWQWVLLEAVPPQWRGARAWNCTSLSRGQSWIHMHPRRKLYKSPGLESSFSDLVGSPVGIDWLLILVKQEISEGFPC